MPSLISGHYFDVHFSEKRDKQIGFMSSGEKNGQYVELPALCLLSSYH